MTTGNLLRSALLFISRILVIICPRAPHGSAGARGDDDAAGMKQLRGDSKSQPPPDLPVFVTLSTHCDAMDDEWEVVPSKKQLRQEQQERRHQVEQQQQQQQQQQQPPRTSGGRAQEYQRTGRGAGKRGMAAPSMVPTPLTVIVLVGTPGCGKSTFCAALNDALARSTAIPGGVIPQPVRVSQDDLGGRKPCEALSESALRAGHNIVIDRCNFDQQQRSTWLRIGKRFGATVVAAFLNTPIETCKQRVMRRTKHPTLGPTAESMAVVDRFRSMLKPPRESEGFSLIVEAGEDMASVQTAAHTLADHLVAAMLAGLPAPESAAAAPDADTGASVSRSFSMRAMERLLAEPSLSAPQRAAAAAALAQQQDAGAASAAARLFPTGGSTELEQARLEGEVRALNRLAAATRSPADGGAAMLVTAAPAAHPAELLQIRAEIDRLRSELGLESSRGEASSSTSNNGGAGGFPQFNVNAPAWQPSREW